MQQPTSATGSSTAAPENTEGASPLASTASLEPAASPPAATEGAGVLPGPPCSGELLTLEMSVSASWGTLGCTFLIYFAPHTVALVHGNFFSLQQSGVNAL